MASYNESNKTGDREVINMEKNKEVIINGAVPNPLIFDNFMDLLKDIDDEADSCLIITLRGEGRTWNILTTEGVDGISQLMEYDENYNTAKVPNEWSLEYLIALLEESKHWDTTPQVEELINHLLGKLQSEL
jgi:hypothetical protein